VPEEVHWARLAVEPAAELLEDGVRPVEDAPEACDGFVVPRGVFGVFAERRRHRDTERLLKNRDVDAQVAEGLVQVGVEPRNRHAAREREGLDPPVPTLHDESVVDEVERDLELGFPVVEATRGQAANVDVERRVPPVVARRRRGQADLAEDLAVEVERILGRAPVCEVKLGESHGRSSTKVTSST
jgi:hypothetical protein